MASAPEIHARFPEYWSWIAVALFLLVTVDMLTTVFAARAVGLGFERNPLVRWSLGRGMLVFAALNLLTVVVVAGLFDRIVDWLDATAHPYDRYAAAGIEAWLGGLLAAGLLVFANNLAVIVHGRSLL